MVFQYYGFELDGSKKLTLDKFIQQWALPLFLMVLASAFYFLPEPFVSFLQFNRPAILNGEWWRLITGHLMHANHWHLLMNLGAFAVLLAIHGMHLTLLRLLVLFIGGSLLTGLALLWLSPNTMIYTGLSGWLHGLIIWGACVDICKKWQSGWLILLGVFAKVLWEQYTGGSPEMVALIGVNVAVNSHLFGALSGLMLFAILQTIPALKVSINPVR